MSTGSWSWNQTGSLDALRPGGQVGPYTVVGLLGEGTSSRVFRVRDTGGRELALKVLSTVNPASVRRFAQEGQVTASLRHPGIVSVYGAGLVGAYPYLVYEFVAGATLAQRLTDLDREARLRVVYEVAEAVGFAHSHGVLHRDIKAENVIVAESGEARVVDFGLAQVAGVERMTQTGAWIGSPTYMSPEQIAGHRDRFGPPTDVWGLGILLYCVLAGQVPFGAENVVELMAQIAGATPMPLEEHDPSLPPELIAVCTKALAKKPADRYSDGAAFAAALDAARHAPAHVPELAQPRSWSMLAGLACLIGLGGLGFALLPQTPPPPAPPPVAPVVDEHAQALDAARAALAAKDADAAIDLLEPLVSRALARSEVSGSERTLLAHAYTLRATTQRREQKDVEAAAVSIQRALELSPDDTLVLIEHGWSLFVTSDFEAALRVFARLVVDDPELATAHFGRGLSFFQLRSFGEALPPLQRAVELKPSRRTWAWLARVHTRLSDPAKAREAVAKALDYELEERSNPNEADAILLCERAQASYALEDFAAAEADCSRALEADPDQANATHLRGLAIARQGGRHDEALIDFERACELEPDAVNRLHDLVHHQQRRGDVGAQLELTEQGVTAHPNHAHMRFDRALAYQRSAAFSQAAADLKFLLEHGQNLPPALRFRIYELRAEVRAYQGTDGVEADLQLAWSIATKTGAELRARVARGRIFCLLGDPRRALTEVTVFRGAERVQQQEAFVFERLRARLIAGDFLAAEEELQEFMRVNATPSSNSYNAVMLGALNPEAARAQLEALDPDGWLHAVGRHLLGEGPATELLDAARALNRPYSSDMTVAERTCEAHFYTALALERQGHADIAKAHYRACLSTGVASYQEMQLSLGRLRVMAAR